MCACARTHTHTHTHTLHSIWQSCKPDPIACIIVIPVLMMERAASGAQWQFSSWARPAMLGGKEGCCWEHLIWRQPCFSWDNLK